MSEAAGSAPSGQPEQATTAGAGVPHRVGDVSFWYADHGLPETRRPALPGNLQADIAIIGAGYTGLWTAYYLRKAAPQLRVVVLEKEFAGFGASGRNGGWCMGVMAWDQNRYATTHGREAVLDMVSALEGTVPEIARVCAEEGIDADLRETEELMIASNPAQLERLEEEIAHRQGWGEGHRIRALSAEEVRQRINVPGALGAMSVSGMLRVQQTVKCEAKRPKRDLLALDRMRAARTRGPTAPSTARTRSPPSPSFRITCNASRSPPSRATSRRA